MDFNFQQVILPSGSLDREVRVDIYLPPALSSAPRLLIFNDGQLLGRMGLESTLQTLSVTGRIQPPLILAVHAGRDRLLEFGTAGEPDFAGRGIRAAEYTDFIREELVPQVMSRLGIARFAEKAFGGFSLGGLSALDIVWRHPEEFTKVGVFSGSLWWRSRDLGQGYVEAVDRIMHARIRRGNFIPGLKFFFECGSRDETMDRNGNGLIDSVEDTQDLIRELELKGYRRPEDICYMLVREGLHHESTWAAALPRFLVWGWGAS